MAITIPRGTTYTMGYQHTHNGTNYPLTGATVYFTVKSTEFDDTMPDTAALIRKDITSHTDPTNGYTIIALSPQDTEYQYGGTVPIEPGDYVCDIKVKESTGAVYKVYETTFSITGSPTNRSGL